MTKNPDVTTSRIHSIEDRLRQRFAVVTDDLMDDEEAPTECAKDRCVNQLRAVADLMGNGESVPMPHVSTLGGGNIECYWSRGDRSLFWSIGPETESALQRIESGENDVHSLEAINSPTVEDLLSSILWTIDDDRKPGESRG